MGFKDQIERLKREMYDCYIHNDGETIKFSASISIGKPPVRRPTAADRKRFEQGTDDIDEFYRRAMNSHWQDLVAIVGSKYPVVLKNAGFTAEGFELMDCFFPSQLDTGDPTQALDEPQRRRDYLGYCLHSDCEDSSDGSVQESGRASQ